MRAMSMMRVQGERERHARITMEYELPVNETGVVQGQTLWCPACRCALAHRVAVPAGTLTLDYYCHNSGCPNHRRTARAPIRLQVTVEDEHSAPRVKKV